MIARFKCKKYVSTESNKKICLVLNYGVDDILEFKINEK